jgi:hypothetical protein
MRLFYILFLSFFAAVTNAQLAGNSLKIEQSSIANYLSIPDPLGNSLNNDMTIEAWIYVPCSYIAGNGYTIIGKGGTSDRSYTLFLDNHNLRVVKSSDGTSSTGVSYITTGSLIQPNTWYHIAMVMSGTSVTFYVNGALAVSVLQTGTAFIGFFNSATPIAVGGFPDVSNTQVAPFLGNIDDLRIWHTARTATEILANYNTELVGNEAGLYCYWKLNESGVGCGITAINSASVTGSTFNGATVGCTSNISFQNNSSIPNCATGPLLWLKADVGISYDVSNKVSQWNDQSGNGHHASAAAALQPTYIINTLNGKPVLNFDGTDGMVTNNIDMTNTNKADVFVIFQDDLTEAALSSIFDTRGNLSPDIGTTMESNITASSLQGGTNDHGIATGLRGNNQYSYTSTAGQATAKCFKMVENRCDMGLTTLESTMYINGVYIPRTAGNKDFNNTGNFGNTYATIGYFSNAYNLKGNIAEIIVYNRVLTATERTTVENYLTTKYFVGDATTQFNTLTSASSVISNSTFTDAIWKHIYNTSQPDQIITSVKDNCLDLGAINSTVYNDATATLNGGQYTMRRHFTIKPTLSPAGAKRVRLYYSDADFADLQTVVPSLTSASQLVVTKYTGTNEDGVYDASGGTLTFIPSAQITTGTAYGANYLEFDVTGFSEFWIHTGTIVLPLHFLYFNAQKCGDKNICLNWQTANEQNVSHFEIERSVDGRTFTAVATRTADNQFTNIYNTVDDIALLQSARQIYYRIKQIDNDRKFSYTNVQLVKLTDKFIISVYPNPVRDIINILGWNTITQMQLYDVSGKKINEWQQPQPTINLSKIGNGIYILKAQLKTGETVEQKIIVQH